MRLIIAIILLYIVSGVLGLPLGLKTDSESLDQASRVPSFQSVDAHDAVKLFPRVIPPTGVTFGQHANRELGNLRGMNAHDRTVAHQYNDQVVINHAPPQAQSAIITHIAHTGGSDPTEPVHVTAQYFSSHNPSMQNIIRSTYVDSQGVTRHAVNHHIYPGPHNPLPSSYATAEQRRLNNLPTTNPNHGLHIHY